MTACIWYPSDSATATTTNTTDWNFASTSTSSSYNDTWHIRITFDASIPDDDFGDCGGYIP